MKSIVKFTDDILVGPDTHIAAEGESIIVCPKNDFAYIIECGDTEIADTLATNVKTLISTTGERVLHIEKTISISC